jgi:uncharacterized protein (DUF58 family)
VSSDLSFLYKALRFQPQIAASNFQGGRRLTAQKGESLEFSDMREYFPGDDIRRIDWNAYARLDSLNVKLFHDEQNIVVNLIIDTSQSMFYKSTCLLKLLEATAMIAFSSGDRICLYTLEQGKALFRGSYQGAASETNFRKALGQIYFEGASQLDSSLGRARGLIRGRGISLVFSDFMEEGFGLKGLKHFNLRQEDVVAIQLLNEDEIHPEMGGDVSLLDCEENSSTDISVSRRLLDRYQENLREMRGQIKYMMKGWGRHYLFLSSETEVHDFLTQAKRLGFLG